MLIAIFFIVHCLVVLVVMSKYNLKLSRLSALLTLFLIFFPVVGVVTFVYVANGKWKNDKTPAELAGIADEWLDDDDDSDEASDEQMTAVKDVIPLEEALLLNNKSVRRELIIDAIFKNPDRYIKLLQEARLNDDIEVVHYATTILSELSTKYETRLAEFEKELNQTFVTTETRKAYVDFLYQYLSSGLAEGHFGQVLKDRYISDLWEMLFQGSIPEDLSDFTRLARVLIDDHNLSQLEILSRHMMTVFPEEEETWMVRLDLIIAKKSSAELGQFLQILQDAPVYFSKENREIIAFWQQGIA